MNSSQLVTDLRPTPAKLFVAGLIIIGWALMIAHSLQSMTHHEMDRGWAPCGFYVGISDVGHYGSGYDGSDPDANI